MVRVLSERPTAMRRLSPVLLTTSHPLKISNSTFPIISIAWHKNAHFSLQRAIETFKGPAVLSSTRPCNPTTKNPVYPSSIGYSKPKRMQIGSPSPGTPDPVLNLRGSRAYQLAPWETMIHTTWSASMAQQAQARLVPSDTTIIIPHRRIPYR
jgi:hypothetical protein